MKTSIYLPSISFIFSIPQSDLVASPNAKRNSSSEAAPGLSVLFPRITIGIFAISGVDKI